MSSSREVLKEFEYLLEKSQRSFNRLRDLPPYGNSRWEHHFHKAFHIYSKLWKFQQENRRVCLQQGPAVSLHSSCVLLSQQQKRH